MYDLLTVDSVPNYIAAQPHLAARIDSRHLTTREVGDGNLNLVFLCQDAAGRGLCLKQALPYVRLVGADWPLTPERATAEARAYNASMQLAPEFVPEFYGFDQQRYILQMESLSDWSVWRTALNAGQIHTSVGRDLGRYVARLTFGTSLFGLDAAEHKAHLAEAINPELCKITEDLVFTEPYLDHPHNSYVPELGPVVELLRGNTTVLAEVQGLKYAFMTRAESLIHGDLHTGSVMVRAGQAARVIDPEFCFYGPPGFDLGALFGNYLIARVRGQILKRTRPYLDWVRQLPSETWNAFVDELHALWPQRVDDWFGEDFRVAWLRQTLRDAAGFGACKAIRRIIGLAKVSDIQSLEGEAHVRAASLVLLTAQRWLLARAALESIDDLLLLTDTSLGALAPA